MGKPFDQKPKKISLKVKSKLSSEQGDKTGIKKDTSEIGETTVVFEEAEKELPSKPTTEDESVIVTTVGDAPEPSIVQLPDQKEIPTEETNTILVLKPSDRAPKKISSKVKSQMSPEHEEPSIENLTAELKKKSVKKPVKVEDQINVK